MNEVDSEETIWKGIVRNHWLKAVPFIIVIFGAVLSGIFVFLWYLETQGGTFVYATWTFNSFSFASSIVFLFWGAITEFLLVFLPTLAVLAIIAGIFWLIMSDESKEELKNGFKERKEREKEEKKWHQKKGTKGGGGGGFTGVTIFVFLIIAALRGNWETPFGDLNFYYFVETFVWAMFWLAIIIGIPALIFGLIWFWKKVL